MSALSADRRFIPPKHIHFSLWYSFMLEAEYIPGTVAAERIRQIVKKKKTLIQLVGSRTRDLPACSIEH
jgi:hypothetical protein